LKGEFMTKQFEFKMDKNNGLDEFRFVCNHEDGINSVCDVKLLIIKVNEFRTGKKPLVRKEVFARISCNRCGQSVEKKLANAMLAEVIGDSRR
jgi:hypothetical protein